MKNGDGKPTVLIVEDDPGLSRALGNLLEFEGYRSVVSRSGKDALVSISEENLDAALIDIHLPDMNGLALSHILRTQHGSEIPIVVISGDASKETTSKMPASGANVFLKKPLDSDILLARLAELFPRHPELHQNSFPPCDDACG